MTLNNSESLNRKISHNYMLYSVYVTLHEKKLSVYKDRLTFEYKQKPSLTIFLDNVTDV